MAYTSTQKKDIAGDAALQAAETGAKFAAMGTAVAPGLGTLIGGVLGLAIGTAQGVTGGMANVEEEKAEKESMNAAEDAAKIQGAGTPADSKVLETSMPVQGGGASSSSYFNWRQNTHGY